MFTTVISGRFGVWRQKKDRAYVPTDVGACRLRDLFAHCPFLNARRNNEDGVDNVGSDRHRSANTMKHSLTLLVLSPVNDNGELR